MSANPYDPICHGCGRRLDTETLVERLKRRSECADSELAALRERVAELEAGAVTAHADFRTLNDGICAALTRAEQAEAQRDELRSWKESALAVDDEWRLIPAAVGMDWRRPPAASLGKSLALETLRLVQACVAERDAARAEVERARAAYVRYQDEMHSAHLHRLHAVEAEVERLRAALGDPESIARRFHDAYERLAPHYGYETRAESAVPWDDVPAQNRALMVATVRAALSPPPEAPPP